MWRHVEGQVHKTIGGSPGCLLRVLWQERKGLPRGQYSASVCAWERLSEFLSDLRKTAEALNLCWKLNYLCPTPNNSVCVNACILTAACCVGARVSL